MSDTPTNPIVVLLSLIRAEIDGSLADIAASGASPDALVADLERDVTALRALLGGPPPIEQTLDALRAGGFVLSNVFQIIEERSPFGAPGWKVCVRHERSTQSGFAFAPTLAQALAQAQRSPRPGAPLPTPVRLGGGPANDEDLW